jgi:hypothetical protein
MERKNAKVSSREGRATISSVKTRVLVVEEESAISEPLAGHLAREGFDADVAANLGEARDALQRNAPDGGTCVEARFRPSTTEPAGH